MTKLIISEKAKVTKTMAEAFSWKSIGAGCYVGTFQNERTIAASASGHLMELEPISVAAPNATWDDPTSLTPLVAFERMVPIKDTQGKPKPVQPFTLLTKFKDICAQENITEIIIATDPDREGEKIGWEIIEYCGYRGRVTRAWFGSGNDEYSIKQAMQNLFNAELTLPMAYASEARARSDINYAFLTMAYTYYAQRGTFGFELSQGKGQGGVMSVGRVQTPLVAMVVMREIEIANFKPTTFFTISALFGVDEKSPIAAKYKPVFSESAIGSNIPGVMWKGASDDEIADKPEGTSGTSSAEPYFIDETAVAQFARRLKSQGGLASVKAFDVNLKVEQPPKTFALAQAQNAIAKVIHKSAPVVQTILEDLYEQGYLSYARTSKCEIPINYHKPQQRNAMLAALFDLDELSEAAHRVADIHNGMDKQYKPFTPSCYTQKANEEHHGIVPTPQRMTKKAFNELVPVKQKGKYSTEDLQTAYITVCKQYVQALYPPAKYNTQKLVVSVPVVDLLNNPESLFSLSSQSLVDPGWHRAFNVGTTESVIPPFKVGQFIPLLDVLVKASKTRPPKRYTEANLPSQMANVGKNESNPRYAALLKSADGIGTPATRSAHITNVISRGYIKVKLGEYYACRKGIDLIKAVPTILRNPTMTALWEAVLENICETKNLAKARSMRDEFILKQRRNVDTMIEDLNKEHLATVGTKVKNVSQTVTPKMKNYIEFIADKLGIPLPAGIYDDPLKATSFINENESKVVSEPTPKQLKLACQIQDGLKEPILTDEMKKSAREVSAFIAKYSGTVVIAPSANQIDYLKNLLNDETSGFNVPPEAFTDRTIYDKTLSRLKETGHFKPSAHTMAQLKLLAKKLPEGQSIPPSVYTDKKAAKAFIKQHQSLLPKRSKFSSSLHYSVRPKR